MGDEVKRKEQNATSNAKHKVTQEQKAEVYL